MENGLQCTQPQRATIAVKISFSIKIKGQSHVLGTNKRPQSTICYEISCHFDWKSCVL